MTAVARSCVLPAFLLVFLVASAPARGAQLDVSITGTTTLVDPALATTFNFLGGESVSVHIVYDTTGAVDAGSSPFSSTYLGQIELFDVTIGSYSASLPAVSSGGRIDVFDAASDAVVWSSTELVGADVGGLALEVGSVSIDGPSTWLTSTALIGDPTVFDFVGLGGDGALTFGASDQVNWSIDTFSVTAVPEPGLAGLVAIAAVALGAAGRGRRRAGRPSAQRL